MSHEEHPFPTPEDAKRLGAAAADLLEQAKRHSDDLRVLRARTAAALDQAREMAGEDADGAADLVTEIEAALPMQVPALQEANAKIAEAFAALDGVLRDGQCSLAATVETVTTIEHCVEAYESRCAALEVPASPLPQAPPAPANEPPMTERRAEPRIPVDCTVDFSSESNFYSGFATDLSSLGMFVATYDALSPGTLVQLSFQLPSGVRVEAAAEVRWVREENPYVPDMSPGMGLCFEPLDDTHRDAVRMFLGKRAPFFYPDD